MLIRDPMYWILTANGFFKLFSWKNVTPLKPIPFKHISARDRRVFPNVDITPRLRTLTYRLKQAYAITYMATQHFP